MCGGDRVGEEEKGKHKNYMCILRERHTHREIDSDVALIVNRRTFQCQGIIIAVYFAKPSVNWLHKYKQLETGLDLNLALYLSLGSIICCVT